MAFNWQTFRTRTLTAAVFVIVVIAALAWNQWSFLALFSIIHFGCWWEYLGLMEKIHRVTYHAYTKLGLMVIGYGLMLWFCGPVFEIKGYEVKSNLSLPVSAAGFGLVLIGIFQKTTITLQSFGVAALGLLYISLSWGMMMDLYKPADIHIYDTMLVVALDMIPFMIILSIWVNDTMAYIVGSVIGKTPLSKISPKKTWEGTIGGIILCIATMGFLFPLLFFKTTLPAISVFIAISAAIAAISGTFGDLLESKLKRMAGVKDSGSIMPGHGGFLDRFDSLLIATPCIWLYLRFFIH